MIRIANSNSYGLKKRGLPWFYFFGCRISHQVVLDVPELQYTTEVRMLVPTLFLAVSCWSRHISGTRESLGLVCLTGKPKVGFQDDEPDSLLIYMLTLTTIIGRGNNQKGLLMVFQGTPV